MLGRNNHQMKWSFKNHDAGVTAEVFYAPKKLFLPKMLLKIHDPNKKVVSLLHKSFINHKINPILSFVELTFDFFTDEVVKIRDFVNSYTFMKNARSKPGKINTTYYLNNLRRSARGMRTYPKSELKCFRIEVTLKRQLLKRLNLSFPFKSIDSLDLTRFFLFRMVDQESLYKYLIWSNRKLIEKIDQKRPGFGNLVVCQISSWINSIVIDDYGRTTPLMNQIAALKFENGIPNYSRFLLQLEDFGSEFIRQVSVQKFLR